MKKKVISFLLVLCLVSFIIPTISEADNEYIFTAINDTLLPLNTASMPVYTNGSLYIPYTVFVYNGFGIYSSWFNGGTTLCLYDSSSTLFFDMEKGNAFSESNKSFDISAVYINGTLYVPAYFVAGLFRLTCSVISSSATIVRICSGSQSYGNSSFASLCESEIRETLEALNPPVPPTPDKPDEEPENYQNVTLLLSFRDISGENCRSILDTLNRWNLRVCFFVTPDEINENADLIRRITGCGHSIGIYLNNGTYEEFEDGQRLLFEAAMITTSLTSSPEDVRKISEAVCAEHGLIYRAADILDSNGSSLNYLTSSLSKTSGMKQVLLLRCDEQTDSFLSDFIWTINKFHYNLQQITDVFPM